MFRIVKLKYIIAPKLNLLKLNSKTKITLSEVVSIQLWSQGFQALDNAEFGHYPSKVHESRVRP